MRSGMAQEGSIETDRPDQTEATSITPTGRMQVEHGIAYEREGGTSLVAHPSTLFRFGVSERFELRTVFEPVTMSADGAPTVGGILPMEFGGKLALWRSDDGASAVSLIAHLQLPHLASSAFRTSRAVPLVRLTAATPVGEDWKLGVNAGMEWDGGGGPAQAIYTAAVGSSLTEAVGWYGEMYGFIADDGSPADHRLNGGLTWLVNDDLQLDAAVGWGVTGVPAPWFVGVGASYRFSLLP
jgi:hypothetical protein